MSEHDGATPAGFGVRAAIARARQVATQKTSRWSHASDASSDFHDVAWVVLFVLIKLRDGLVDLRNQADDSDAEPPQPGGGAPYLAAQFAYQQTLAYFDNRAAAEPEAFNYKGEGGKASALLAVLQAKDQQYRREQEEAANRAAEASTSVEVAEADTAHDGLAPEAPSAIEPNGPERTDLDRWRTRVANVARRLEQARRWFRLRVRTSAGIALLTLEAADAMQPPLKLMDPDVGPAGMLSDMLKLVSSSDYSLLKVADDDRLTEADVGVIADRVADVRSTTERLHEELRRRIGTTRSRLALVHRFKLRCEWHDRQRMAAVG